MDITNFTTKELQFELEKRTIRYEAEPAPVAIKNPDTEPLKRMIDKYIEFVSGPNYCEDNDYDHDIFETAVETIYGKQFWVWLNQNS